MARRARHGVRIDLDLEARITVDRTDHTCTISNLSTGGAYVAQAGEDLEIEDFLLVDFFLPEHGARIVAPSWVRWRDEGGVGVQFGGLRHREVWTLDRFLQSQA